MKTFVVFRQESEHARAVLSFLRDFERQTGKSIEAVDPDSRDGADLCRVYDIVEYPTVVALDSTGVMQTMWRGMPLPTISEVSYYVQ